MKGALNTAGAVGTIAVGEVSNYIADYLEGEPSQDTVLVHEAVTEPEIAKEEAPVEKTEGKPVEETKETPSEPPSEHQEDAHPVEETAVEEKLAQEEQPAEEAPVEATETQA